MPPLDGFLADGGTNDSAALTFDDIVALHAEFAQNTESFAIDDALI